MTVCKRMYLSARHLTHDTLERLRFCDLTVNMSGSLMTFAYDRDNTGTVDYEYEDNISNIPEDLLQVLRYAFKQRRIDNTDFVIFNDTTPNHELPVYPG